MCVTAAGPGRAHKIYFLPEGLWAHSQCHEFTNKRLMALLVSIKMDLLIRVPTIGIAESFTDLCVDPAAGFPMVFILPETHQQLIIYLLFPGFAVRRPEIPGGANKNKVQ